MFSDYKKIKYLKRILKKLIENYSTLKMLRDYRLVKKEKSYFHTKKVNKIINEKAPYPIMFSGASGLNIIKDNKVISLLQPAKNFYVFGIACTQKRIYISLNFHMKLRSQLSDLLNNRISLILSANIKSLKKSFNEECPISDWRIDLISEKKNLSYLNIIDNKLIISDYLGFCEIYQLQNNGSILKKSLKSICLAKLNSNEIPFFYPFMHLNSISADHNFLYVGSHQYSKFTNINSKLYKISRQNYDITIARETDFISAHDMLMIKGNFYGCDSHNSRLFKNKKCIYKSKNEFFRGLSVNDKGIVLGSSVYQVDRAERFKLNLSNKIIYLNKNGDYVSTLYPKTSSIYRIYSLDSYEYTQSFSEKVL